MKAIDTQYKGYQFRSRLEARWAVYFDSLGCEWEYELEGFKLPSGWYLPDFWLTTVDMWAEVKPVAFSDEEEAKCIDLASASGYSVLQLVGTPALIPYLAVEAPDRFGGADKMDYALDNMYLYERRFYTQPDEMSWFEGAARAVDAARGARFEGHAFDLSPRRTL